MEVDYLREETLAEGKVIKRVIREGDASEGKPVDGADVTVHYVGTLLDGTVFDSSRKRNEPFKFKIGEGSVIKGWDVGVATMVPGEVVQLEIAPDFAYGERGSPPTIPANATLRFEVELISWSNTEDVTDDGRVTKSVRVKGEGWDTPREDAKCRFKVAAFHQRGAKAKAADRTAFDLGGYGDDVVERTIGSDTDMMFGLECALKSMKAGEQATVFVPPEYAFGKDGNAALGVPTGNDVYVVLDVTLVSFDQAKMTSAMTTQEKVEYARTKKALGTVYFKQKALDRALDKYELVNDLFSYMDEFKDEDEETRATIKQLRVDALNNMAAANMLLKHPDEALGNCNEVLLLDPRNVKALVKRGRLYLEKKENDKAQADLRTAVEVDRNHTLANKLLKTANARIHKVKERERKLFGGMFNKVKLVD
eukprot:TRINITY_DN65938_c7_g2_i1.p1 TRINITY_DN65938_c7_g2~~TRINITY_DN65938_c7_g2_i1.p1  ORF type:complete len:470 (-),score=271.39 TRINITY_DN65938_c7_g2_i1:1395-2663(-)